jgi:hypothetical protein
MFRIGVHKTEPFAELEGAASVAGGLTENVSEAILDRIKIDDLRPINDPVTTGQDASAF